MRRHGPCCSVAKVPGGDGWGGVEARLGRGWGDAASGCRNQFRSTPPVRTPAESPAILCSGEDAPDNTYVKCKEGSREQISIDRKSVGFPGADSGCFPIKVRKRKDGAVTWLIRQRCIADDMSRSVWIANYTRDGDYLYYNAVEAP